MQGVQRLRVLGMAIVLMVALVPRPAYAQNEQAPQDQPPTEHQPPAETPAAAPTEQDHDAYCASLPEDERRRTEVCKTPEERAEDAAYKRVVEEREEKEKPTHSSFLKWL